MSTTRTKTPYKLEVMSADGSQTGSVLNATITNAGVVDVDISGNLSVAGTTTYVETTNLKISDAIISFPFISSEPIFNKPTFGLLFGYNEV